MNNFEKIKQSNVDDFSAWIAEIVFTASFPIKFPIQNERDWSREIGIRAIKQWLQSESED